MIASTLQLQQLYKDGKLAGNLDIIPLESNYVLQTHYIDGTDYALPTKVRMLVEVFSDFKPSNTPLIDHLQIMGLTKNCFIKLPKDHNLSVKSD